MEITVAPHGGAWIEIYNHRMEVIICHMSPLTEGRGLKCRVQRSSRIKALVAPHGGAWIEIV